MRDLAENLAVLDAIRPAIVGAAAEVNVRANGTHNVATEIDLADYGYPRKLLICIEVGTVASGGSIKIDIEGGNTTLTLSQIIALTDMTAAGLQVYEIESAYRFYNIEITGVSADVTCSAFVVMEHCRFGNMGSDD